MDTNKQGKFIAQLRKEKGLTQQELANKLFITDKAVSKWERGLSLPDITLITKLASILEVDVVDILEGKRGTNKKINIEKKITEELSLIHKKKIKKILILVTSLILIIITLIFKNLSLGYTINKVNYTHSNRFIHIGVPKTSFLMKHNDRSYSYKNLRNTSIIENEVKQYLKTLKYSTCNDTIYYYNEKDNFSIIDYSIKNNILYNTLSYEIVNDDYCFSKKLDEYANKLGGLKRFHTLNGWKISLEEEWDTNFEVIFLDDINELHEFKASLQVILYKRTSNKSYNTIILEESLGSFEIKEDKLYYYREEIKKSSSNIKIPEVSTFLIKDTKLILQDSYLNDYNKNIILK